MRPFRRPLWAEPTLGADIGGFAGWFFDPAQIPMRRTRLFCPQNGVRPMSRLTSEPTASIRSMDELLAVAMAMEKESADRYAGLAKRMRAAGRQELADVFDRLVREETGHIDTVVSWSRQVIHRSPKVLPPEAAPHDVFDDEAIGLVSPELVDAYRSFAVAVRNEERAFAFWSYVAANAETTEMREAAERMARDELEHAKSLRRER